MATQIVAIRLSGGTNFEHITRCYWVDDTGEEVWTTREPMVTHVQNGGVVYTEKHGDRAYCEVIIPSNGPKYVRTKPDSSIGNNLLSLPRR